MTIDSSLADGHEWQYYAERSSQIGNGIHRRGGVVEVPITTYRARSRILDFNGSSFEEICFVVVRSLELGLRSVTMLMHSWSLSEIQETPLLAKGFHYASSPTLCEKLERVLDFLHELAGVELSTLRESVAQTATQATLPTFPPTHFEIDPGPLHVLAWQEGEWVVGRCELAAEPFLGGPEYAFYLVVQGERVATRWYEQGAEACFLLPPGTSRSAVEVQGFARDRKNPGNPLIKGARLL